MGEDFIEACVDLDRSIRRKIDWPRLAEYALEYENLIGLSRPEQSAAEDDLHKRISEHLAIATKDICTEIDFVFGGEQMSEIDLVPVKMLIGQVKITAEQQNMRSWNNMVPEIDTKRVQKWWGFICNPIHLYHRVIVEHLQNIVDTQGVALKKGSAQSNLQGVRFFQKKQRLFMLAELGFFNLEIFRGVDQGIKHQFAAVLTTGDKETARKICNSQTKALPNEEKMAEVQDYISHYLSKDL